MTTQEQTVIDAASNYIDFLRALPDKPEGYELDEAKHKRIMLAVAVDKMREEQL